MNKIWVFLICVLIPLAIGWISSAFTRSSVSTWYTEINKASFNPPGWVFGPAWTILYVLMGISLYLVWTTSGSSLWKWGIGIFIVQLILNFLWSIFFFGMHAPILAFMDIILLWIAILANIILFWQINPTAAYLLIPYILWVSFASVLNLFIVLLN
ncbi:MAG: TspO/MBR family protein [Candidatus Woesearchaeota archaeon]|jgi:tryptophan-rich sensory protein